MVVSLAADSILATLSEHVTAGIKLVADSLASGFLTTSLILAVIAVLLTLVAVKLGRDDLE